MSIGDFLESLSQAMLVGTTLVGILGVSRLRQHHLCADEREWGGCLQPGQQLLPGDITQCSLL